MSITLSDGITTVALDPDLMWLDENSWHEVEQSVVRSITGAQIISVARRIGGRSITLQQPDDSSAWMTHGDVEQIKAWAAIPGKQMILTIRCIEHAVVFDHPNPMTAVPIVDYSEVESGDWFRVSFKFLEI